MERKMMKIRVEIAERPYQLTISADEEERVRRAARQIRDRIETLKRKFDATLIEYLSMAAIQISIENEENKERLRMNPETLRLRDLASELERWAGEGGDNDGTGDPVVHTPAPIVKPKSKRGRPRKNRTDSDS